jgi:hypothetical protein
MDMFMGSEWGKDGDETLVSTSGEFDVHESVHSDTIMKVTNKMQLYRLIYFSQSALHVSGDVFTHNQEHLTVIFLFRVCKSVRYHTFK